MMPTSSHRPDTVVAHRAAVEKVIRHMKANLTEWDVDCSLAALAFEGRYSKGHLIEIFEEITGTTPHHFLASLRIQKAKELLRHSTAAVTQIALEVGYLSLSTFSRTFAEYVGRAPSSYREAAKVQTRPDLAEAEIPPNAVLPSCDALEGCIEAPRSASGLIFIGTFTKGVPKGRPDSGTVMQGPGTFSLRRPPHPNFFLLAALITAPLSDAYSSYDISPAWIASLRVQNENLDAVRLSLRPACMTDPPLVVSLDALMNWRRQNPNFG
jgi:AraC family transcriptional regulator